MGKIFSWEEIQELEVPGPSDFGTVTHELRSVIELSGAFIAGVIGGSVANRSFNSRSDIDCLVIYKSSSSSETLPLLRRLHRFANDNRVPLDLIAVDSESAGLGIHPIGPSFAAHLQRSGAKNGFLKADPTDFLGMARHSPDQDTMTYLRSKACRLHNDINRFSMMSQEEMNRLIQESLTAPVHAVRKLLWSAGLQLREDTKEATYEAYGDIACSKEAVRQLKQLKGIDERYNEDLDHMVTTGPTRHRFDRVMQNLMQAPSISYQFMRANALAFSAQRQAAVS